MGRLSRDLKRKFENKQNYIFYCHVYLFRKSTHFVINQIRFVTLNAITRTHVLPGTLYFLRNAMPYKVWSPSARPMMIRVTVVPSRSLSVIPPFKYTGIPSSSWKVLYFCRRCGGGHETVEFDLALWNVFMKIFLCVFLSKAFYNAVLAVRDCLRLGEQQKPSKQTFTR